MGDGVWEIGSFTISWCIVIVSGSGRLSPDQVDGVYYYRPTCICIKFIHTYIPSCMQGCRICLTEDFAEWPYSTRLPVELAT
jgi:hypothetical protein